MKELKFFVLAISADYICSQAIKQVMGKLNEKNPGCVAEWVGDTASVDAHMITGSPYDDLRDWICSSRGRVKSCFHTVAGILTIADQKGENEQFWGKTIRDAIRDIAEEGDGIVAVRVRSFDWDLGGHSPSADTEDPYHTRLEDLSITRFNKLRLIVKATGENLDNFVNAYSSIEEALGDLEERHPHATQAVRDEVLAPHYSSK